MFLDFLLERFDIFGQNNAIIYEDDCISYEGLASAIRHWKARLEELKVPRGAVVSVEGDFAPEPIALLMALIDRSCVVVPLSTALGEKKISFKQIAEVEWEIALDSEEKPTIAKSGNQASHFILQGLKSKSHPGLILFSSGSTGESKAAVHDLVPLLEKFKTERPALRSIAFLLFDHIGGFNTMMHMLSNRGCMITVQDRSPDGVCRTIARHRADVLPTSPTFINLILLSEAYKRHDLSSLKVVTYGTEVMPESTLQRFHDLFPDIRLQQTYGLSEVGILRSKSLSSDSLWVKIGGEGFQTRVVDGLLEIKAESAMLGYLNAPSPFTEDGWFKTGDSVIVEGEFLRILGRASELINVGGLKVYPAQVENVIQLMPGVEDVAVVGAPNAITGQIVTARVLVNTGEDLATFRRRMREFCTGRLEPFMIPQRVVFAEKEMHGDRFKKMRPG